MGLIQKKLQDRGDHERSKTVLDEGTNEITITPLVKQPRTETYTVHELGYVAF